VNSLAMSMPVLSLRVMFKTVRLLNRSHAGYVGSSVPILLGSRVLFSQRSVILSWTDSFYFSVKLHHKMI